METDTLLARAHQFDQQALAELHTLYFPVVHRYLQYRLDDPSQVDDLTSEVFMNLLTHLHQHRPEIQNMKGWLLGVANHVMNDHLRRKYRRQTVDIADHEDLPDSQEGASSLVEQSHLQHEIRQALQQLTNEQQHVLALRFSQDLSLEETARVMGKNLNAVKVLQFRALNSLRRVLEKRGIQ